jgi:hypothetical protein
MHGALVYFQSISKTRQTLQIIMTDFVRWGKNLQNLPVVSREVMDNFVKKQSLAKATSLRGYKFFLESYIHDVEGF